MSGAKGVLRVRAEVWKSKTVREQRPYEEGCDTR